jgi:hypothetical protein
MFFLGTTFGGKMIVALSYLIEFMTSFFIETIVFIVLIVEPIITILITFWYQFIDRGWLILQVIGFLLSFISLIYIIFLVPESAKFKYAYSEWDQSRHILKGIATTNGQSQR